MNCPLRSGRKINCEKCAEFKGCEENRKFEESLFLETNEIEKETFVEKFFRMQAECLENIFSNDVFVETSKGQGEQK